MAVPGEQILDFMPVGGTGTGTGHISTFGVSLDAGFSIVVTPDGKKAYVVVQRPRLRQQLTDHL
ncbi:hypothetical protein AB0E62_33710 [Streptomyces sp. NPDC038707]|uniref:hypothetical protein n=1 Tax=unclassified Streptomyces TaxID=2593676 RepID=UPI0033E5280F